MSYDEKDSRTRQMVYRVLVLWELQRAGKLEMAYGTKTALARQLGVGRAALDRSLEVVADAQTAVDQLLFKIAPDYPFAQTDGERLARERFAQRATPGVWLDDQQYTELTKLAGLDTDE